MTQLSADLLKARFLNTDKWRDSYRRNNKKSGVKNLRCFPYCSDPHKMHGFCGCPPELAVDRINLRDDIDIHVWGEFLPEHKVSQLKYINMTMTKEEIEAKVRTRGDPLKPWYQGIVLKSGNNEEIIQIKCEKIGWNYTFIGNKHISDTKHCFVVYIFVKENGVYRCICIQQSPGFTLFCKRKVKKENVETAETKSEKTKTSSATNTLPRGLDMYEIQEKQTAITAPIEDHEAEDYVDFSNPKVKEENQYDEANSDYNRFFTNSKVKEESQHDEANSDNHRLRKTDTRFTNDIFYDVIDQSTSNAFLNDVVLDDIFMDALDQFSNGYRQDSGADNSESRGRKRAVTEDGLLNENSMGFLDFERIPLNLPRPFPLRKVSEGNTALHSEFDIPFDVLPLFGNHEENNPIQYAIHKSLWRICVVLTILDSHWRSFEELFSSDFDDGDRRVSRSASIPEECEYEHPVIKAAFIEVAKAFGSLEYQKEMYTSLKASSILKEKQQAFICCSMKYLQLATSKVGLSMEVFLALFAFDPPEEVVEHAKQRLRCINGVLHSSNKNVDTDLETSDIKPSQNPGLRSRLGENMGHAERFRGKVERNRAYDGIWQYDDDVLDALDHVRSKYIKMNYIMRKIYRYMENEMRVTLTDEDDLKMCSRPFTMTGSFAFVYKMDGTIRKYAEDLIDLPLARTSAFTYRAFWTDEGLIHETYFEDSRSKRLVREYRTLYDINDERKLDERRIIISFEEKEESTGNWTTLYQGEGTTRQIPEFS